MNLFIDYVKNGKKVNNFFIGNIENESDKDNFLIFFKINFPGSKIVKQFCK
jgi:hypothetical protein